VLAFAAALAVATIVCIPFVDRPVAIWCAGLKPWRLAFQACASPSLLPLPLAGIVLVVAALRRGAIGRVWLLTSVATMAASAAKDELKFVFGRPWPSTWLMWGTYGFHPFSNGAFFGSFPSGHTAYVSAPLCVLWVLAPRHRWLWGGVIGLVMVGLVGADYHFVGDVLAGLLTGMGCAWGTLRLMRHVA
jgi:membrane-associated phospholipid phosphatase